MSSKLLILVSVYVLSYASAVLPTDITCFTFFGPDGFWDDFKCPGNQVCKQVVGKGFVCVQETAKDSNGQVEVSSTGSRMEHLHCGEGWLDNDWLFVAQCPASTRCNRDVRGFCVPKGKEGNIAEFKNVKMKRSTFLRCGGGWDLEDPRVTAVCPRGTRCTADNFGLCTPI